MIVALGAGGPHHTSSALAFGSISKTKLVYQAMWSQGAGGWSFAADPHFAVASGVLSYDGTGRTQTLAPFHTTRLPNFAVQATIRGVSPGVSSDVIKAQRLSLGYGIMARVSGGTPQSGFLVGFDDVSGSEAGAVIDWDGGGVGGAGFTPGTDWHTYRLEVRGRSYRLLFDGQEAVGSIRTNDLRGFTGIGIWSSYYQIEVKDFKVFALGRSRVRNAINLDGLRALTTQQADVPTGMARSFWHGSSNAEFARLNQMDLAAVQSKGRIASYRVHYTRSAQEGIFEIRNVVGAYTIPSGAQWGYNLTVQLGLQGSQGAQNFKQLTVGDIGDERTAFSSDQPYRGRMVTLTVIDFRRGNYSVYVQAAAYTGTIQPDQQLSLTIQLAQLVDRRIQQAP
jgi:hypothetical protein